MKHIKPYNIFESVSDDLLDIKDFFQDVSDEWDIYYLDPRELIPKISDAIAGRELEGGGYYCIFEGKDNHHSIIVYLPHSKVGDKTKVNMDILKFNNDVNLFIDRIKHIGYDNATVIHNDINNFLYIISL